jgi:RNA polymerase sigma-70 factor (ECF subfamily)
MSQFPATSWTLIVAAGGGESNTATRRALEHLCEGYWVPLYSYARRRGYSPEDAADHTQGYFVRLIEKNYLRELDVDRGRFRSFLLASFTHYLCNEHDRTRAAKRGGSVSLVPISVEAGERVYALEPSSDLTPERVFERRWATTLLEHAMASLRRDFEKKGKANVFDVLKVYLTGEKHEGQYASHAAQLGVAPGALRVEVHRLRKRFQKAVRDRIAETVSRDEDVEDELRFLIEALQ